MRILRSILFLLFLAHGFCSESQIAAQVSRRQELLPPIDWQSAFPESIRVFGENRWRHGISYQSPGDLFFSADSQTVVVPTHDTLLAFDAATGMMRYQYRYDAPHVSCRFTCTCDPDGGIRLHYTEGPRRGQYAVLDPATGRPSKQGTYPTISDWNVIQILRSQSRAIVKSMPPPDRSRNVWTTKYALYDTLNQQIVTELGEAEHNFGITILSPDQQTVVFISNHVSAPVRLYDCFTGQLKHSYSIGDIRRHVEIHPTWGADSQTLYDYRSSQKSWELFALEVESGKERVLHQSRPYGIHKAVVDSKGDLIAFQTSFGADKPNQWKVLKLSDLSLYREIQVRSAVTRARFSPDGRTLWFISQNGLAPYDLERGEFGASGTDSLAAVDALAFSEDATQLRAAMAGQLLTWDVASGQEIPPRTEIPSEISSSPQARCLWLSPDAKQSVWTDMPSLFAIEGERVVGKHYISNMHLGSDYELSTGLQRIIHNDYQGELRVHNLWTGELIRELNPLQRPRPHYRFAIAPDQQTAAFFLEDLSASPELEVWNIDAGKKLGTIPIGSIGDLQFSRDSRELNFYHGGQVTVWKIADQQRVGSHRAHHRANGWMTPNRNWYLVDRYSYEHIEPRTLQLFDAHTGQIARQWDLSKPLSGRITAATFSRNQKWMAIAGHEVGAVLYPFYKPRPEAASLQNQPASQLVKLLASTDSTAAFDAMCELIRRGDEAIPEIQSALERAPLNPDQIRLLIQQVSSPREEERRTAAETLLNSPGEVSKFVQMALDTADEDIKKRLQEIAAALALGDGSPRRLTEVRSVEVLEAIDTPKSWDFLTRLSQGDEQLTLTHAARVAVKSHLPTF